MTWPIKKLGEVCNINMGQSPASSTYNNSQNGLPFYQGKKDYGEKFPIPRVWCSEPIKIVEAGDILISVRAPVGSLNIAQEKSCIGRGLAGLRSGNKLDQDFLFNFLKLKEKDISNLGTGSTFTAISKKHLENLEIPLPPLATQNKIVAKIEKLMVKIKEAKRLRTEAQASAQNLLPAALHKIFSEGKGWKEKTIGDLALEIRSGFACGQSNIVPDGIVHLRTHNIDLNGILNLDKIIRIPKKLVNKNGYGLEVGDILFNNTNSTELVGKTILIRDKLPYAFSNHLTRMRFDPSSVLPSWILYIFQKLWREKYFENICTRWVGQSGVNQSRLSEIKIPLPPLGEQKKIVAYLDSLSIKTKQIQTLQAQTAGDLAELEQAILHQAFRG